MPQPYLCLFNPLSLSPSELIPRVERVLATAGFTFDGTARKFERGRDGSLYYQLETVNSAHWTEAAAKAIAERWAGVAFECRFRGYDVTVGVLQDKSGTTLTMDHDSVLFYELEKDEELRQQWLGGILELVEQLSATVCVFRKGGLKESVDPLGGHRRCTRGNDEDGAESNPRRRPRFIVPLRRGRGVAPRARQGLLRGDRLHGGLCSLPQPPRLLSRQPQALRDEELVRVVERIGGVRELFDT